MAENSPGPEGPLTRREAREEQDRLEREASGHGGGLLPSGFKTIRDLLSFGLGVAIVIHEVFASGQADPYVVGVGVAFCGLPLVLGADERKAK